MWQAEIYVTFKRGVLDPQGETIRSGLVALGFQDVAGVRVGKYMVVQLAAVDEVAARGAVDEMCRRLLANPVMEEYRFELHRVAEGAAAR